jgi:hypothetical protein
MKNYHFLALILSLSICLTSFADGDPGGGVSGGGDAYVSQFTRIGYDVLKLLERQSIKGIDKVKFKNFLLTVRVVSAKKLILQGKEVDAINTPSKKLIQISRTRWDEISSQPKKKFVFVAHEYFSVMGLTDARYQFSEKLFDTPGVPLYEYTCHLLPAWEGTGIEFIMKAAVYKDFVNVNFFTQEGKLLETDISSFYAFALSEPGDSKLEVNAIISVGLGLTTQMISLPYSTEKDDHRINSSKYNANVLFVDSLEVKDQRRGTIPCIVKKYQ